jgi:hypothetical protein
MVFNTTRRQVMAADTFGCSSDNKTINFSEESMQTRDREIARIYSSLSSPEFNALRLRVRVHEPEEIISPWNGDTSKEEENQNGAELEPDSQRNQGSR